MLIGVALAACARQGPLPLPVNPQPSAPEAITQLVGYRASYVVDSVFGGQAHLLEVGLSTAPALLLVHGLGDSGARDFFPILPTLAQTYHVYAIDLPGFGRSTHGAALYSPSNYVRFLHDVVRPRIAGAFALVGHSMGGAISLAYAHHHPEDVTRLVLIDAAGILHREALVPLIAQAQIGKFFEPAQGIVGTLTGMVVDHAASPETLLENELVRHHLLSDANQIAAAALILHNFGPAIAELSTETLVVWGRQDVIAPLRTGTLLASRLPKARFAILEQSGHVPMETEPDLLARTIWSWLQVPSSDAPIEPTSVAPTPSTRLGRCDQAQGVQFAGAYRQIDIVGCQNVRLERVQAESVRIWDSQVVIEGTRLNGLDVALYATRSRLELTGCVVAARTAMRIDATEVDAAGSDFTGQVAALQTKAASRILFSVSRITTPKQRRYLHEVVDLGAEQEM